MATGTKSQHYVPQFYLKGFADRTERVFVYDKKFDKIFFTNVKRFTHENYFYGTESGTGPTSTSPTLPRTCPAFAFCHGTPTLDVRSRLKLEEEIC